MKDSIKNLFLLLFLPVKISFDADDKNRFMGVATVLLPTFLTCLKVVFYIALFYMTLQEKTFLNSPLMPFLCIINFQYKDHLRTYNTCNAKDPKKDSIKHHSDVFPVIRKLK